MDIKTHSFTVFDRENFVYRVRAVGAERVKNEYVTAWNQWKNIVEASVKDSGSDNLELENTEHWQNSGNLSRRFWSRIKDTSRLEKPSCIAEMINKDSIRVYLEWHGYKNQNLHEEREQHNNWILFVDEWSQAKSIDKAQYKVWTNKDLDEDYDNYTTLEEFSLDKSVKNRLTDVLKSDSKSWIRIGKVYKKQTVLDHDNITKEMGLTISELEWLYRKASSAPIKNAEEKEVEVNGETNSVENEKVREELNSFLTNKDLIDHIYLYIKSKGFYYTKEELINFFFSLKTKPFVILSGISGTGKTKIVQWFAESVGATEENGQFALIPVRPDWSDGSDLLGYTDIKGDFKQGPLTKVLKEAIDQPERPYFVLLDEMNLARVEHYFSDLLSVMESRKWEDGKLVTSTILSEEIVGREIYLPANVYIIGTVNMDETTHPFSKKVLDRANTLEFNRVKLDYLEFLLDREEKDALVLHNDVFATKYLHLKDVYSVYPELVEEVTSVLVEINKVLQINSANIGYRVRDEICFYLAYNEGSQLMKRNEALDHCILQKILPRLSGSDPRIERVLKGLFKLFTNKEIEYVQDAAMEDVTYAKFPKSADKVLEMMRRLEDDGFTSFWISS